MLSNTVCNHGIVYNRNPVDKLCESESGSGGDGHAGLESRNSVSSTKQPAMSRNPKAHGTTAVSSQNLHHYHRSSLHHRHPALQEQVPKFLRHKEKDSSYDANNRLRPFLPATYIANVIVLLRTSVLTDDDIKAVMETRARVVASDMTPALKTHRLMRLPGGSG